METQFVIVFGLGIVLAFAVNRPRPQTKPAWSQQLKGWQKVFGVIGVAVAMLIIINPEFLALGLLGDTAFFDMLVLALSLQIHMFVASACRQGVMLLARGLRWVGIPSPGFKYLVIIWPLLMRDAAISVRKFSRIFRPYAMA